jgi:hypothetical protein
MNVVVRERLPLTQTAEDMAMLFSFIPPQPLPSYPNRDDDVPAPVYSARVVAEMQSTLAELADFAVRQEMEREPSDQSDTQLPRSDAA